MKPRCFLALLATVAAGCAVGPDYHPPEVQAPAGWSTPLASGATNSPIAEIEWWKNFQDQQLDALIERAVAANHDLRIATARVREARALRGTVVWNFLPTIVGEAGYKDAQRSRNAQTFIGPNQQLHTGTYDAHFDASWEIDIFGGQRRRLQTATALDEAIEEERRGVLISVLAEVTRNYVEVRGYQQQLAIAHKNIAAQTEALAITRDRFRAGLTSELDVSQAESLLAGSRARVPTLETSYQLTSHRLAVLLGQPPGALREELETAAPVPATPPVVPVGLPADLLRRRPDVRQAERELAAATSTIGIETAELFPKFFLLGTGGFQSLSFSDWFSGGSKYWSAGPTVTWRLLEYGRIRGRIKAAGARADQALATYERTVLQAFEDVENALVVHANEQVRHVALAQAVTASRRSFELANDLYTSGLGDFLNVLEAERSLFVAEDQLAESDSDLTENVVALYKALGGGWEQQDEMVETTE